MLEEKFKLDWNKEQIYEGFGLTKEKVDKIINKLRYAATIKPQFIAVSESLLNDSQFSVLEKIFGIFALGKIYGVATIVVKKKLHLHLGGIFASPEQILLSIFIKQLKEGHDKRLLTG